MIAKFLTVFMSPLLIGARRPPNRRALLKPRGASITAPHLVILTLAAFFRRE
jgi:hypothetical protein